MKKGICRRKCTITYQTISELTGISVRTLKRKKSVGEFDFDKPESVVRFVAAYLLLKKE